ncbi:hypothetical protein L195_g003279 [Trifolium pratense]|uniref:Uncharacterized protein n=1 Tax=Trifolium pratense TaxID=57577 RepID=A0A2K3NUV1_TRIPR|nr:hypothetical protein L195_g003279 [Trifolium pratense]
MVGKQSAKKRTPIKKEAESSLVKGKVSGREEKSNFLHIGCISADKTTRQGYCCISRNNDKEVQHVHQLTGEGQQMPLQ